VIGPIPDRPAHAFSQMASRPVPIGVTPPIPVITTRGVDIAAYLY